MQCFTFNILALICQRLHGAPWKRMARSYSYDPMSWECYLYLRILWVNVIISKFIYRSSQCYCWLFKNLAYLKKHLIKFPRYLQPLRFASIPIIALHDWCLHISDMLQYFNSHYFPITVWYKLKFSSSKHRIIVTCVLTLLGCKNVYHW